MFIDNAKVIIHAGDGGDGRSSFRHEKFVDRGGPDGGDGGDGGHVVFVASLSENTLASFRFQRELIAESGAAGGMNNRHGKRGKELRVRVPVGTTILNSDGKLLADLVIDNMQAVIAQGGKGGFGNAHFVSSVRQAPRVAEKGEPGEVLEINLELKMIADVGLIGLPNAGKSTLLSIISNAKPEIADYPFTTLTPNLGVVDIDKKDSLLFADIPGLIEGAAEGKGLGDDFLRHVERTSILVHLIDIYGEDVTKAYSTIQTELKNYKINLSDRPQVIALTKIDGLDKDVIKMVENELKAVIPKTTPIFTISSKTKTGTVELLRYVLKVVRKQQSLLAAKKQSSKDDIPIIRLPATAEPWRIVREKDQFVILGRKIERFAMRTDFSSDDGTRRLRDIMKKMGITHELTRQGAKAGSKISIGKSRQYTLIY
jgi:GTP-binding protein